MVREQGGKLIVLVGVHLFKGSCDPAVHPCASLFQLTAIRDFLGQRVNEREFGGRVDCAFVDEFESREVLE